MRNLRLLVEYDGTDFHGFQKQPRVRTVQAELEKGLSRLLEEPVTVIGAGRTDAGVHATGQVVNFRTTRPIPVDRLPRAASDLLPADLVVRAAAEAPAEFHARRHARWRRYRYAILCRAEPSALLARYSYRVAERPELSAMREAAARLLGEHDFRAFQAAGSETWTTVRRLRRLDLEDRGALILVTVEADSFLYQMVRLLVAALLAVGRGELGAAELEGLLRGGDRRRLPGPAPARGLCLIRVGYEDDAEARERGKSDAETEDV